MTRSSKEKRAYAKFKNFEEHDEFLTRISKTLYYTKLPVTDCLSLPVTELAAEIFTEVKNGQTLERLDVDEASRISRNACVSPCSLVVALLYLERLKDCNPEYLRRVAPSELFLVSLMVASKFLNDDGEEDEVFNFEWAESGHLSTARMNRLEKEFLQAIDWSIYIHNHDFWRRFHRLERDVAAKEARKRGWYSYTDLSSLLDSVHLAALLHTLLSVSSICLATYTAGFLALFGSALVAAASLQPNSSSSSSSSSPEREASRSANASRAKYNSQLPPLEGAPMQQLDAEVRDSTALLLLLEAIARDDEREFCNESLPATRVTSKDPANRTIVASYYYYYDSWRWLFDSMAYWLPGARSSYFEPRSVFLAERLLPEIEGLGAESWKDVNYLSRITLSRGK